MMTEQPIERPEAVLDAEQWAEVNNPRVRALELEMAYTTWDQSCQDPHITYDKELRQCRRAKNHEGPHASGFASTRSLRVWT